MNYQLVLDDGCGVPVQTVILANVRNIESVKSDRAQVMRVGNTQVYLLDKYLWGYKAIDLDLQEQGESHEILEAFDQFNHFLNGFTEKVQEGGDQDDGVPHTSFSMGNGRNGNVVDLQARACKVHKRRYSKEFRA